MSNEWKELNINALPIDWFGGDYEIEQIPGYECKKDMNTRLEILKDILNHVAYYRYRKPEPLPPTHEEIMKPRFWQMDNKDYWRSITGVKRIDSGSIHYLLYDGWCDTEFFVNRKSSDLLAEPK